MNQKEKEKEPLVSVICTCHNQAPYVAAALESVLRQDYSNVALFVIDNGSSDSSQEVIRDWEEKNKNQIEIRYQFHDTPINYCRAFNMALTQVRGDYVVDLAADDFLAPRHLTRAVHRLQETEAKIYFSNVLQLFSDGRARPFYPVDDSGKATVPVLAGNVFAAVVRRYIISSASLVLDAAVLKAAGGYDETLAYEDFDLLVRMARDHAFVYGDFLGVNKRILAGSLSTRQYQSGHSVLLPSTFRVCEKVAALVRTEEEKHALKFRILHETKHSLASANFKMARQFLELYAGNFPRNWKFYLFKVWLLTKWDVSRTYEWWIKKQVL
ncbi:glycosyltransferase family 2 protein [Cyclobacterium jeungdonense]|uniref:Glycosyltransferase n=1 Tax=Cyclobacterium jeungdonense TaxID=708087 RepID=A0ABT8C702_9BACT|nr:glycosyltransferase [Cyclobacterium jeungdonense]MDN3688295.1 glycosyltransferase [Cyclobacterium jeungdonense]